MNYPAGTISRIALAALSLSIGTVAPYIHHLPPNSVCGTNEHFCCNYISGASDCDFSWGETTLAHSSPSSCCKFRVCGDLGYGGKSIPNTLSKRESSAGGSECLSLQAENSVPSPFICQGHLPDHCWICQLLSVVRSYLGVGNSPCLYNTFCCSADLNCFTPPLLEAYRVPVARGPPSTSPS